MSRHRFIARRAIAAVPVLFGVVLTTFVLTHALPGDPAAYFSGPEASRESVQALRKKLGLDRSLAAQFGVYLKDLAHGDLGSSLTTGQPVLTELRQRLPASLELTLVAFVLAVVIAIPLGVLAATRPGSWIDHLSRVVTTVGVAQPTFVTGLVLIYVFYYILGWAPSPLGRLDSFVAPPRPVTGLYLVDGLVQGDLRVVWLSLSKLILPAVTMAVFALAPLARMTRAAMLGVLGSEFMRTARAMGLPRWKALYVYAFRNAIMTVLTTVGMVFSYMLGANVLVEKVFSWPGIGSFALDALAAADYAPVQGFVLMMGVVYVVINTLVDILYTVLDPRAQVG